MTCTERRMTYARAGEIFRAMQGDMDMRDRVYLHDIIGMEHADTFAEFIDANRDSLQLYDPPYTVMFKWSQSIELEKYYLVEKDLDISAR